MSRREPDSRLVLEIMVERVNNEVTTRPLHLFSLLVEFLKGVEYFQILPPQPPCTDFLEQEEAPTGTLFPSRVIFEISHASISERFLLEVGI